MTERLEEMRQLLADSRRRLGDLAARVGAVRARLGTAEATRAPVAPRAPFADAPAGTPEIEDLDLQFEAIRVEGADSGKLPEG